MPQMNQDEKVEKQGHSEDPVDDTPTDSTSPRDGSKELQNLVSSSIKFVQFSTSAAVQISLLPVTVPFHLTCAAVNQTLKILPFTHNDEPQILLLEQDRSSDAEDADEEDDVEDALADEKSQSSESSTNLVFDVVGNVAHGLQNVLFGGGNSEEDQQDVEPSFEKITAYASISENDNNNYSGWEEEEDDDVWEPLKEETSEIIETQGSPIDDTNEVKPICIEKKENSIEVQPKSKILETQGGGAAKLISDLNSIFSVSQESSTSSTNEAPIETIVETPDSPINSENEVKPILIEKKESSTNNKARAEKTVEIQDNPIKPMSEAKANFIEVNPVSKVTPISTKNRSAISFTNKARTQKIAESQGNPIFPLKESSISPTPGKKQAEKNAEGSLVYLISGVKPVSFEKKESSNIAKPICMDPICNGDSNDISTSATMEAIHPPLESSHFYLRVCEMGLDASRFRASIDGQSRKDGIPHLITSPTDNSAHKSKDRSHQQYNAITLLELRYQQNQQSIPRMSSLQNNKEGQFICDITGHALSRMVDNAIDLALSGHHQQYHQFVTKGVQLNPSISSSSSSSHQDTKYESTIPIPSWKCEGSTSKLLQKHAISDASEYYAMLEKEILIWSGTMDTHNEKSNKNNNYYGKEIPIFKTNGIIPNISPSELIELLLDSSQVKRYNKFISERRDICQLHSSSPIREDDSLENGMSDSSEHKSSELDVSIAIGGMGSNHHEDFSYYETKLVECETKVPFTNKGIVMTNLMHAMTLQVKNTDSSSSSTASTAERNCGYILVSRTVYPEDEIVFDFPTGSKKKEGKLQQAPCKPGKTNELIWGVTILLEVEGHPNKTELLNVTQANSSMVPNFLVHRVGVSCASEFINGLRSL